MIDAELEPRNITEVEPTTETKTDLEPEPTDRTNLVAPEPTTPTPMFTDLPTTVPTDVTPLEPNILHIFYDA